MQTSTREEEEEFTSAEETEEGGEWLFGQKYGRKSGNGKKRRDHFGQNLSGIPRKREEEEEEEKEEENRRRRRLPRLQDKQSFFFVRKEK